MDIGDWPGRGGSLQAGDRPVWVIFEAPSGDFGVSEEEVERKGCRRDGPSRHERVAGRPRPGLRSEQQSKLEDGEALTPAAARDEVLAIMPASGAANLGTATPR